MIAGKIWGQTETLVSTPFVSVHRASAKAGFRCSKHLHRHKANWFYVESGELAIRVYQDSGLEDVTVLGPGQSTTVPPGIKHRFECTKDATFLEVYWPQELSEDIERDDVGGQI